MGNPLNQCSFIGRLTATPELHKTKSEKSVTNFSLAVNRKMPDADGNWPVDFIDFAAWGSKAEKICESWKRGDMVKVDGRLEIRSYTDKDGNKHSVAEIQVDEQRKLMSARSSVSEMSSDHVTPPPPTDADFTELPDNTEVPFPVE